MTYLSEYLKIAEAARLLGVSQNTLRSWAEAGKIPVRRDDLPETIRNRHSPVGGTERQALRALSDHSALILDGIRSTIGEDLHLGRGRLVQEVIQQMESMQVVLVSLAASLTPYQRVSALQPVSHSAPIRAYASGSCFIRNFPPTYISKEK